MTPKEKQMLDELFQKLHQMEIESAPRSAEADRLLQDYLRQQPAAPYYMAQLLLLQKDALANAKEQIEALEAQVEKNVDRLPEKQPSAINSPQSTTQPTYNRRSFLEGAAQTALGIGGGLLLADFVTGLFDATMGEDVSAVDESTLEESIVMEDAPSATNFDPFDATDTTDEAAPSMVGGGFGLSDFDLFSYDVGRFL